jgi:hypothetical protein
VFSGSEDDDDSVARSDGSEDYEAEAASESDSDNSWGGKKRNVRNSFFLHSSMIFIFTMASQVSKATKRNVRQHLPRYVSLLHSLMIHPCHSLFFQQCSTRQAQAKESTQKVQQRPIRGRE